MAAWLKIFSLLTIFSVGNSINRRVYKVILTQKGFTQFLQYDIEAPPLREFTFCSWFKLNEVINEQSLFSYVTHGNNRVVRLWLDSGGRHMKVAVNEKVSSNPVDFTKDVWRHICLSYQSDFGAWALYIDGRLVSCEAAQSLSGFIIPRRGSVIIGYGIGENGRSSGLEGEVFGANMLLVSTIERNYTLKRNPSLRQTRIHKNKVVAKDSNKYIVLGDLDSDVTQHDIEPTTSSSPSAIHEDNTVELDLATDKIEQIEKGVLGDSGSYSPMKLTTTDDKTRSMVNEYNVAERFTKPIIVSNTSYSLKYMSTTPKYETPLYTSNYDLYLTESNSTFKQNFKLYIEKNNMTHFTRQTSLKKVGITTLEPIIWDGNDTKTRRNLKFSGSVTSLNHFNNYLKNKFELLKKQTATSLLLDSVKYPFTSDFKTPKIVVPLKFHKNNFAKAFNVVKRSIHSSKTNNTVSNKYSHVSESIRRNNLKTGVKITEQTVNKQHSHRFVRHINEQNKNNNINEQSMPQPLFFKRNIINKSHIPIEFKRSNLFTRLPFIKTTEYYLDEADISKSYNKTNPKTQTNSNKWHNVKSYSNDYTPRKWHLDSERYKNNIDKNSFEFNKKLPSIRLKYIPNNNKIVKSVEEKSITLGRALAKDVSNNSNPIVNSVSILKYNHGYLPGHEEITKKRNLYYESNQKENKFNNHSNKKMGRNQITAGFDQTQKNNNAYKMIGKNRYKSSVDFTEDNPISNGEKMCKNLELFSRILYIQPDDSVDITNILSPVKEKNIAIDFVIFNYKKCSLQESVMENDPFIFIDWRKTPVRLFGGAYPKKTTDLCGFF